MGGGVGEDGADGDLVIAPVVEELEVEGLIKLDERVLNVTEDSDELGLGGTERADPPG